MSIGIYDDYSEFLRVSRSYTATYSHGSSLRKHMFIGPDSFLDAVALAEEQREENEHLINVTELT